MTLLYTGVEPPALHGSDQCYECGRRNPAADILNEENISYSFDVQVIVDELKYEGRSIRGIVPPALRGDAV